MASPQPQLDHVVLLLPYSLVTDPPAWLADAFTLSPGGRHADGKTENRLVLFSDGTYLELIAFVDDAPENRKGHWWDKPYGVVDYAFTTKDATLDVESLNERLEGAASRVRYEKPKNGGRKRPDGVEMEWKVTFPRTDGDGGGVQRGEVPFWCHDVTPRDRRVPVTAESTRHPCGAMGIAGVIAVMTEAMLEEVVKALGVITTREADADSKAGVERNFNIGVPIDHQDLQGRKPSIRLRSNSDESGRALALSLVVRCPSDAALRDDIQHDIEGGTVTIKFERC